VKSRPGWVPDGVHNNASPGVSKSKPAPQQSSLFDEDGQSVPKPAKVGVERAIENADPWFTKRALEALKAPETRRRREPFEWYSIEQQFGVIAEHGSAIGALIKRAVKERIIVAVGHKYTERPTANGREVRTYLAVETAAELGIKPLSARAS
jgi:Tfp pilus assembly protein PilP